MKKQKHLVKDVLPDSIAMEMEVEPGDEVLSVNGQTIEDVFDYHYLINDEYVLLLIRKPDGEEWELEIEKDPQEDLGIQFENPLMDEYRSCSNHCIFCFIDQMPQGMRDTLYFKDDDSRLSFLQGNYVTLTNMSDHDIDRIIQYHLAPINISFHVADPKLRCEMLHNRFAGQIFEKVDRLYQAQIPMNGQIVLCKGINDGQQLDATIEKLSQYIPCLESVSVVPVGITKYRDGLYPLETFGKEDARATLEIISRWQETLYEKYGKHFIHASDEWYILADQPLPEEKHYDGYPQLENGVGMLRLLETEVETCLKTLTIKQVDRKVSIATGHLAAPFIEQCGKRICQQVPGLQIKVYPITNEFFGEQITVSGLITGADLAQQLSGMDLGQELLLPCNMLRSGEETFLDDWTVTQLQEKLGITIQVVDQTGQDLIEAILGTKKDHKVKRRQIYEQTDSSHSGQTQCGEINPV